MTASRVTVPVTLEEFWLGGVQVCLELSIDAECHYWPGDRITPPDSEVEYGVVDVLSIDDRKPTPEEVAFIRAWMDKEYDWSDLDDEAYKLAD